MDRRTEPPSLPAGLYEQLVTRRLRSAIDAQAHLRAVEEDVADAEQPEVLARHVGAVAERALAATRDPAVRLELVNRLVTELKAHEEALPESQGQPRQLLAVADREAPGAFRLETVRPATPLSDAALLTNARGEPSLGAELRAELESADAVDLLCAFVQWRGVRILEGPLIERARRHAPLRVITTTYVGATERRALDTLVRDLGAHVKITYETASTRLHAKAWLFRRGSGFDTAYVGSSNLSRSALLDGLEWNVRLAAHATPSLLEKFRATFDSYWADEAFETYDPDRDADRLDEALAVAGGRSSTGRVTISLSGLEVRPYPHQREILEALDAERTVHDRHRNLVVAATGTGKTVVAALDYKRLRQETYGRDLSLLFVAHRQEILNQSLRTYQEVLADASFGEPYVGGARPTRWRHVFASIQSLSALGVGTLVPDAFDVVVVDEFHHAEATTYRRLLDHVRPLELLGLTATPERADGVDVRAFFEGRTAAELRLWDALAGDLLCPFHYFGVADGTDLASVAWKRGAYDAAGLSDLYTGNDARARIVLRAVRDIVDDPAGMRALGFCVSVAHAEYMARVFREAGLPSLAVSGATPTAQREAALAALRDGHVTTLFAADLFNEGLDLPDVDTVLFLRPTESATVFLQQLGRGLRRARGKAVLTVLDFVGHHRREFRFDVRYRALTGSTRRELEAQVTNGFPYLPSGSQIVLDRKTAELVLENIRSQVAPRWPRLVAELRSYASVRGDVDLPTFLREAGLGLPDIYKSNRSWTSLRSEAGLPLRGRGSHADALLKRVRALAHVDDAARVAAYRELLDDGAPAYDALDERMQAYARMLFFSLWPGGGGFSSYADALAGGAGLSGLAPEEAVRDEIREVLDVALDAAAHSTAPLSGALAGVPLAVHARYTREELLAALGHASLTRAPNSMREGVAWCPATNADALLVTLTKDEGHFSPSTRYRDYALSPQMFHWESQSTTSVASPTGQRYLHHRERDSHVLLFVRERRTGETGTEPYVFLGPASYVEHRGERPIAITWRLDRPMPADLYPVAAIAV